MGVAADTGQIKGFLFYTNLNHSSQIRMFKEILISKLSLIQINMDSEIPLPDRQEVQTQKLESSSLLFLPALLPKVAPALCRARKTDHWSSVLTPSPQQSLKGRLPPSCRQGSRPNEETTLPHAVMPPEFLFTVAIPPSHVQITCSHINRFAKQRLEATAVLYILLWFLLKAFHESAPRSWLGLVSSCQFLAHLSGIWTANVQKAGSQNIWSSSRHLCPCGLAM